MLLTDRQIEILKILLHHREPQTVKQIAVQLDVTSRIVHYNLNSIEYWLEAKGTQLTKDPQSGILFDIDAEQRKKLERELDNLVQSSVVLSPENRRNKLLLILFSTEEPVLVKEQTKELGVSRVTVLKDLKNAGIWLEQHNLQLTSRPNLGSYIEGPESQWREAEVSFVLETSYEICLMLLQGKPSKEYLSQIERIWGSRYSPLALFDTWDLLSCYRLIENFERQLNIRYEDMARLSITIHLAILIQRIKKGKNIESLPEKTFDPSNQNIVEMSEKVMNQIQKRYQIKFSRSDINFITMQFLGSKTVRPVSEIDYDLSTHLEVPQEILDIAQSILDRASPYLHPSLATDKKTKKSLAIHLKSVYHRLKYNLPIRNPLLSEIKSQYPVIYQAAQTSSSVLAEKLSIEVSEEEIGYIAMYLGAAVERLRTFNRKKVRVATICAEGVATARLLVSRLLAEFSNVEVAQSMSVSEFFENKILPNIDVVLSTVPIKSKIKVPVLMISPIPTKHDLDKMRELFSTLSSPPESIPLESLTEGPALSNILVPNLIKLGVEAQDWEQVADNVGGLLLEQDTIEPRFIEAMKATIRKHGPYIVTVPGVALFHAHPRDGVKELSVSLITLKQPVYFGNPDTDPVEVAFALAAPNSNTHLRILADLVILFQDEAALKVIRNARTVSEVTDVISKIHER